ncbi:glycoside hydrolase family 16 protein [Rugosimonospora africana]|uniref:GH16 domain-containing protein n=1 Tax=Rugosimonospora africana TaxID=556532 RepID=A0A8J3VQH5_9ACTN|nr:glycoside hydrolase family 16 protein [Rugosimonospora africana]GIH14486.1 hypothetical protein Raf01_26580 [Rugosimonospora africana]
MTSYGDEPHSRSSWSPPNPERQAWPVAPSHTPPVPPTSSPPAAEGADAGTGALDTPTDALAQLTAADLGTVRQAPPPGPAAFPAQPVTAPPVTTSPVRTSPVTRAPVSASPTSPAPYLMSAPPAPGPAPTSAPPLAPADRSGSRRGAGSAEPDRSDAPGRRGRAGWLALATAAVVVLLGGVFAVVKLAGSDGDRAPSAVTVAGSGRPSDAATSAPAGGTGGEQAAAGTSGSPSAGPSRGGSSPTAANPTHAAAKPAGPISDDFTSALNTSMWNVYGTTAGSTYNSTMVRVAGGELQVLGAGNSPTASANKSGGLCWCGTNGNRLYGKWQVRARFDAGSGYRQVLELWPQSDNDTADGRIKFAGDTDAAKKTLELSVLQPGGARSWTGTRSGDFTAWHTYTVEWRANSVTMSLDGTQVYDSATSGTALTIPSKPMHLVIQQDKGPGNGIPAANASTPAQVVMHVDWVRYYP